MSSCLRLAFALSLLLPSAALALPGDLLRSVEIGEKQEPATSAFTGSAKSANVPFKTLSATVAQEYAQALLRNDFLAALNRAKAKHSLTENAADRKVSFVQTEAAGQRTVLAFANGMVEAAFVRTSVKPDTASGARDNPHLRQRLAPLQKHLANLRDAGCSLSAEKSGRNAFVHRGSCGNSVVYVEYRPEADEYWTVYSARK